MYLSIPSIGNVFFPTHYCVVVCVKQYLYYIFVFAVNSGGVVKYVLSVGAEGVALTEVTMLRNKPSNL